MHWKKVKNYSRDSITLCSDLDPTTTVFRWSEHLLDQAKSRVGKWKETFQQCSQSDIQTTKTTSLPRRTDTDRHPAIHPSIKQRCNVSFHDNGNKKNAKNDSDDNDETTKVVMP